MKSPLPTVLAGGVAVIEVETDIGRPADQVFDYASDPANEPEWNIRMTRLEKLTSGPVGVGARYQMKFTQGPPATSECVEFQRPQSWEFAGESKILTSTFGGRVVPAGNGCHLLLRMQIRPRGLLQLALPLLRRRMRRELERDIAAIKTHIEGSRGHPSFRDNPATSHSDSQMRTATSKGGLGAPSRACPWRAR